MVENIPPKDAIAIKNLCETSNNSSQSSGEVEKRIDPSNIPIIRSFIVLRKENFGGYIFNPYLPPESRLDNIRFKIATLCDGSRTVEEIENCLSNDLAHNREYVDFLVEGALKELDKQYAIYWRKQKPTSPISLDSANSPVNNEIISAPLFVIWEITSACNLKCEHCLSDSGKPCQNELSTQEAKELIDTLSEMKVFIINFSGGEPLIRPDMFELLEYASKKHIGIDLLTNGRLITEKTVDRLEKTNVFNIQVSLDGLEDTHDKFRGLKGSYQQAISAIKLLLRRNFNVVVNSVVTKENMNEIPLIIDKLVNLGVKGHKTTLFMPTGRGKGNIEKLLLSPEDVKNFTIMMINKKKEVGNKIHLASETEYPWMKKLNCNADCSKYEVDKSSKVGCTAGSTSLYITSDGKFAPCPFLRQLSAGDVRTDLLEKIWGSSPTFNIFRNIKSSDIKGKCNNCEYLGISCYGGCRAAALAYSGDLYEEDPNCWKHLSQ